MMLWPDDYDDTIDTSLPTRPETWLDRALGWALLIGVLVLGAYAIAGSVQ